jgi:hypothetical protein
VLQLPGRDPVLFGGGYMRVSTPSVRGTDGKLDLEEAANRLHLKYNLTEPAKQTQRPSLSKLLPTSKLIHAIIAVLTMFEVYDLRHSPTLNACLRVVIRVCVRDAESLVLTTTPFVQFPR